MPEAKSPRAPEAPVAPAPPQDAAGRAEQAVVLDVLDMDARAEGMAARERTRATAVDSGRGCSHGKASLGPCDHGFHGTTRERVA